MHRFTTPAVVIGLISPLAAQAVRAGLVANAPITMTVTATGGGTFSTSQPAAGLPLSGSVYIPGQSPTLASIVWGPIPGAYAGWRFENHMWAVYPTPSQTVFDCTLEIAHIDAMGHLSIDLMTQGDFPASSTVDVFDDGVIDAALTGVSFASAHADVHLALPLSLVPTRLRIRLTASVPAPIFHHVEVRWHPWVPSAQDLGSACGPNPLQPGIFENYFLGALPGTGGNAVDFVAHGLGAGVFLVALHPRRLPTGTFGFSYGCDDLLAAPVLTSPGTLVAPRQWSLPVPPLPPGLQLFVQHVSQGTLHLGATNLIAYGT